MRSNKATFGFFTVAGLMLATAITASAALNAQAPALTAATEPPGLRISMYSQLTPIPLNQMHSWIIDIKPDDSTAFIEALPHAVIHVTGGMPAHNHGLATSPQITEYLGNGRYRLEGVRFHMAGEWTLQLQIELDQNTYTALLELTL